LIDTKVLVVFESDSADGCWVLREIVHAKTVVVVVVDVDNTVSNTAAWPLAIATGRRANRFAERNNALVARVRQTMAWEVRPRVEAVLAITITHVDDVVLECHVVTAVVHLGGICIKEEVGANVVPRAPVVGVKALR